MLVIFFNCAKSGYLNFFTSSCHEISGGCEFKLNYFKL